MPWTDEQIAVAIEAEAGTAPDEFVRAKWYRIAAWVRRGHLANWVLSYALNRLVTTCTLCGKKALYRYGNQGRCSEHRLVTPAYVAERMRRLNLSAADIENFQGDADRAQRHHQAVGKRTRWQDRRT